MKVVIVGDVCHAQKKNYKTDIQTSVFDNADIVIGNLEGAIVNDEELERIRGKAMLYCSSDVMEIIKKCNINTLCLANNHMFDVKNGYNSTVEILNKKEIKYFGAGKDRHDAMLPFVLKKNSQSCAVFGFGWDVIGCKIAQKSSEGVNPLDAENAINLIHNFRKQDKTSYVIFIMHWNYELERYPQPADRLLAKELIREGVDAIIGMHPHVVQGAELIDGRPVVYSLGNWFFPPRQFGNITIQYPEESRLELAVEIEFEQRTTKSVQFHWYNFSEEQSKIEYKCSEGIRGPMICSLTPFADMTHGNYIDWFKKNRARRKGLPIYIDYKDPYNIIIKKTWVILRHKLIQLLVKVKVKKALSK